ncbi:MAG: hypothetical protein EAZ43_15205, partial [Betaproteobacteria bacterium]
LPDTAFIQPDQPRLLNPEFTPASGSYLDWKILVISRQYVAWKRFVGADSIQYRSHKLAATNESHASIFRHRFRRLAADERGLFIARSKKICVHQR